MNIRDRIKELRRVPAGELVPNPRNWRIHPPAQAAALEGILQEVGYADALLAREREDGRLELIDGHLRAETTPEAVVPVLVLDLNDAEAAALLAVLDPLAAMAKKDAEAFEALAGQIAFENTALRELIARSTDSSTDMPPHCLPDDEPTDDFPFLFQLIVECRDEDQQRALYERLRAEGFECRVVNVG